MQCISLVLLRVDHNYFSVYSPELLLEYLAILDYPRNPGNHLNRSDRNPYYYPHQSIPCHSPCHCFFVHKVFRFLFRSIFSLFVTRASCIAFIFEYLLLISVILVLLLRGITFRLAGNYIFCQHRQLFLRDYSSELSSHLPEL